MVFPLNPRREFRTSGYGMGWGILGLLLIVACFFLGGGAVCLLVRLCNIPGMVVCSSLCA